MRKTFFRVVLSLLFLGCVASSCAREPRPADIARAATAHDAGSAASRYRDAFDSRVPFPCVTKREDPKTKAMTCVPGERVSSDSEIWFRVVPDAGTEPFGNSCVTECTRNIWVLHPGDACAEKIRDPVTNLLTCVETEPYRKRECAERVCTCGDSEGRVFAWPMAVCERKGFATPASEFVR